MKQISFLTKLFMLFAVIGFFASCDPIEVTDKPIVNLQTGEDAITGDATVDSGATFKVIVNAIKGSNPMNSFEVLADGELLDSDRFTIDGQADNNPKLLFGTDKDELTYTLEIKAQATGDVVYEFVVSDEGGVTSGKETITISIDPGTTGPSLSISGSSTVNLDNPATNFKFTLSATPGGADLATLTVYEDGVTVGTSRLDYGEITVPFSSNPLDLPAEDVAGFTKDVYLDTHTSFTTKTYSFVVTDADGNEATATVDITIAGQPLPVVFTGVFMYNNSGTNFGAIDLETGTNVSSLGTDGDLVDAGNDNDGIWLQTIAPAAGTTLKTVSGYTFDGVTTVDDLLAAYNSGAEVSNSGVLTVGSTFTANVGSRYFIFTVASVNPTAADNLDYYTFNIKGTN